jgi:hypothetical protein
MKINYARKARTVAVLGTIAALGGGVAIADAQGTTHSTANSSYGATGQTGSMGAPHGPKLTTGERTALEAVQKAIKAQTTSIATPILDSAVTAGTITSAQETSLLTLISKGPINGPAGGPGGMHGPPGQGHGAPPSA